MPRSGRPPRRSCRRRSRARTRSGDRLRGPRGPRRSSPRRCRAHRPSRAAPRRRPVARRRPRPPRSAPRRRVPLLLGRRLPSAGGASSISTAPLPLPFSAAVCCSAISSVRVPESASTWCSESSAPSRSFGGSSASSRSSPSSSEKSWRHPIEGSSAPALDLRERAVERPPPRGAGGQRLRALSFEQEGLAGELRRPLDLCA